MSRLEDLTEERDLALGALQEMERHLTTLQEQLATAIEERDWARRNLVLHEEELIALRGKEEQLTDALIRVRKELEAARQEEAKLRTRIETQADGEGWGWDDRSELTIQIGRLREDLELATAERDRALSARDALAQQALMAGIQRTSTAGLWARRVLNFVMLVLMLAALALFGQVFPRLLPDASDGGTIPPGVEVRPEIIVPAAEADDSAPSSEDQ